MYLKNLLEISVLLLCIIKGLQANIDCNGTQENNEETDLQKANALSAFIYGNIDNNITRYSENVELSTSKSYTEDNISKTTDDYNPVSVSLLCIIKGLQANFNIDCNGTQKNNEDTDLQKANELSAFIYGNINNNITRYSENVELSTSKLYIEDNVSKTTDDYNPVSISLLCNIKGLQANFNIDCNGTQKNNEDTDLQKANELSAFIYGNIDNNITRYSENVELSTSKLYTEDNVSKTTDDYNPTTTREDDEDLGLRVGEPSALIASMLGR